MYDLDDFLRQIVIHYTVSSHQDILLGIMDIRLEKNACVFYIKKSYTLTTKGLNEDEIREYFRHLFFAMELCKKIELKTCICLERLRYSKSMQKGLFDPFDYGFINKTRTCIDYSSQEYHDPYGECDTTSIWQLGICLEKLVTNSYNGVSNECIDFMSMFLKPPEERIRIDQIKTHPWFLTNLAHNRNDDFRQIDEVYITNKVNEYKGLIIAKMHSCI